MGWNVTRWVGRVHVGEVCCGEVGRQVAGLVGVMRLSMWQGTLG